MESEFPLPPDATPNLRISLGLELSPESDIGQAIEMLIRVMDADDRVLEDPAPMVYILDVDPQRIKVVGYNC